MAEGQAPEPAAIPSSDVFVSYASQDKTVADAIVGALERSGLRCWIAPRDVRPGTVYADAIVGAINGSKTLVLVLSANAMPSAHVGREVERAASKRKQLIAFRVDTTPLSRELEYFLSNCQWIDVGPGGIDAAAGKLIDAIRAPEQTAPRNIAPAPLATSALPASATIPRSSRKRLLLTAGLAAVAVILAALYVPKFWRAEHAPGERATGATTSAASLIDKSIAVLPFVDMSEKHDQEYFGDGMAEEILNLLAKIPGLTVIGRTSSFQFKGKSEDLRTIGAKLGAAYVLEGSVRTSGDQVRVTAQLINTRTGAHEWSESYDRHIGDVLKLQDAVAAAVARQLELTVPPNASQLHASLKSADAYKLLLRALHAMDRNDKEGFEESASLLQQALELDPTSALATSALAWTYEFQGEFGFVPAAEAFEHARRTALAARKLDPTDLWAHGVLARIYVVYDWDWVAADREYKQITALAPGSDIARDRSYLSLALGQWDEALTDIKALVNMDPLSPGAQLVLSWIQARRGDLSAAEGAARRTLDISPTYAFAHYYLGLVLIARGDRNGALAEMEREVDDATRLNGLALAYQALGRKAEAEAALARMLKEQARDNAFGIAEVYAARGQPVEAVHWLERAYAQKDVSLFYVKGDLPLKSIEGDPRFKAFLRKMNLPE